jgi:hypothetical protein
VAAFPLRFDCRSTSSGPEHAEGSSSQAGFFSHLPNLSPSHLPSLALPPFVIRHLPSVLRHLCYRNGIGFPVRNARAWHRAMICPF